MEKIFFFCTTISHGNFHHHKAILLTLVICEHFIDDSIHFFNFFLRRASGVTCVPIYKYQCAFCKRSFSKTCARRLSCRTNWPLRCFIRTSISYLIYKYYEMNEDSDTVQRRSLNIPTFQMRPIIPTICHVSNASDEAIFTKYLFYDMIFTKYLGYGLLENRMCS